ncbi:hypothetical protein GobsT_05800 [Gemmata obscuriglobus]|nr:hypothetical protein GobsT_05800 [Gemmata obscuriglobus]VTR99814.1 unnamed protein product [Gemmata obscuriglobus UQM 2246]
MKAGWIDILYILLIMSKSSWPLRRTLVMPALASGWPWHLEWGCASSRAFKCLE